MGISWLFAVFLQMAEHFLEEFGLCFEEVKNLFCLLQSGLFLRDHRLLFL